MSKRKKTFLPSRSTPFFFVGNTEGLPDERRALLQMYSHFHKASILDDLNRKALDRAGSVGDAVRELFDAIDMMIKVEGGEHFRELEDHRTKGIARELEANSLSSENAVK